MLIQQTLIQYLLQKKNLCDIFKVLTIWGNINLFIRPQHHADQGVKRVPGGKDDDVCPVRRGDKPGVCPKGY